MRHRSQGSLPGPLPRPTRLHDIRALFLCAYFPSRCPSPCEDPNCGRLNSYLRGGARPPPRLRDVGELLVRAAVQLYLVLHPRSYPRPQGPPESQRRGWHLRIWPSRVRRRTLSFRELAPSEASLTARVQQRLAADFPTHQQVPSDVSGAIRGCAGPLVPSRLGA